jgi:hypothetical protein
VDAGRRLLEGQTRLGGRHSASGLRNSNNVGGITDINSRCVTRGIAESIISSAGCELLQL